LSTPQPTLTDAEDIDRSKDASTLDEP